jgi:hypothetical protein
MDDDDRSPLRRAVIKLVSLIGAGAIIIGVNAWLDWEPPKIRDVAGRTWYVERGDGAPEAAAATCRALDGRAVYWGGPYASGKVVSFCCGPPNASSSACDMP